MVNDISQICGSKTICSIHGKNLEREKFQLPDEYNKLLSKYQIKGEKVKIYWEKSVRNVGKKEILRQFKFNKLIKLDKNGFYVNDKELFGKIVLTRAQESDKYGVPACPLIMAALAVKQNKDGYANSVNFYYIGADNLKNIPNHYVIERGKRVLKYFKDDRNNIKRMKIKNIYITQKSDLS